MTPRKHVEDNEEHFIHTTRQNGCKAVVVLDYCSVPCCTSCLLAGQDWANITVTTDGKKTKTNHLVLEPGVFGDGGVDLVFTARNVDAHDLKEKNKGNERGTQQSHLETRSNTSRRHLASPPKNTVESSTATAVPQQ